MEESPSRGLSRYSGLLATTPITLGEPVTPLVEVFLHGRSTLAKVEGVLPTGSFKDRGSAFLVGKLAADSVEQITIDSSGNAGSSMAAYCARANIGCELYVPRTASPAKLVQATVYGARVVKVDGSREDVRAAADAAAARDGSTRVSHLTDPAFLLGTRTFAYELWEQLGCKAPSSVICPLGGGTLLLGLYDAFVDLRRQRLIDSLPRLYGIQSTACAPLAVAFERGATTSSRVTAESSVAEGVLLADPPHGQAILAAVRQTQGGILAVPDEEVWDATILLGRQGLFVEPTSALAAAGALHLIERGEFPIEESLTIALTGTGLKASATVGQFIATAVL